MIATLLCATSTLVLASTPVAAAPVAGTTTVTTQPATLPTFHTIELTFTPTARSQLALWIESADGTFLKTVALTQSVAFRGIGNRPGASQMNSGFRWPYGRREGVLPVWAHRRAAAPGAGVWRRVIFQSRIEGKASRTADDQSADPYFCLSFQSATTRRDALDAVSCATAFTSDKGRFITANDVANGYSEPMEVDGQGLTRILGRHVAVPAPARRRPLHRDRELLRLARPRSVPVGGVVGHARPRRGFDGDPRG